MYEIELSAVIEALQREGGRRRHVENKKPAAAVQRNGNCAEFSTTISRINLSSGKSAATEWCVETMR